MTQPTNSLLSLDIWDTLIRRRTFPDNIKIWSHLRYRILTGQETLIANIDILQERQNAERKLAQQNVDKGFDNEHPIQQVYERLFNLDQETSENIIHFEFETEMKQSYADSKITTEIAPYEKYKQIIISDFYFSAEFLKKLVRVHHPNLKFSELYSSSDFLLNKTGQLFPYLASDIIKESKGDWLHIGDSISSDIEGAKKIGIRSLHFEPNPEHEIRIQHARDFNRRVEMNELSIIQPDDNQLGILVGLIGFNLYIWTEALRTDRQILFLEREGLTLSKFFDLTQKANVLQLPNVESHSIAVSRMSVYSAYAGLNISEVAAKFIFLYPNATPQEFLKSLGVEDLENYSNLNEEIFKFLGNSRNLDELQLHCSQQLENLRKYFASMHFSTRKFLVVDVGWMGSIQEILGKIFNEFDFQGTYLGMYPESKLLKNGQAKSYIDVSNPKTRKIYQNVRPIELLFMPANRGSVRGYDSSGMPIRAEVDEHSNPPEIFTNLIQELLGRFSDGTNWFEENLCTIYEARNIFQNSILQFLQRPNKNYVKAYLEAKYDETFGLGKTVMIGEHSRGAILRSIFTLNIKSLRKIWHSVGWEEAAYFSIFGRIPNSAAQRKLLKLVEELHRNARRFKRLNSLHLIQIKDVQKYRRHFWNSLHNQGIKVTLGKVIAYLNYKGVQVSSRKIGNSGLKAVTNYVKADALFVYSELSPTVKQNIDLINLANDLKFKLMMADFNSLLDHETNAILNKVFIFSDSISPLQRIQVMSCHPKNRFIDDIEQLRSKLNLLDIKPRSEGATAAWIINGLPKGSGGHRGMFRMAHTLKKIGVTNNFYILNEGNSANTILSNFKKHFYDYDINIVTEVPSDFKEDLIFATAPATLEIAKNHTINGSKIFYFVQDDEALFHPVSSSYFKAREDLFDQSLTLVASGPWMKERIKQITGRDVFHFPFPIDHDIYNSHNLALENKKYQLLVYYKPEAVRRLSDVTLNVVDIVKSFLPELDIVSFGSDSIPPLEHAITHLGQLERLDQLAQLYRESSLALMFSPTNPSLLPYEMAACSLPVVDYAEPNDSAKEFFRKETGITLTEATTFGIAYKIVELLSKPIELRKLQESVFYNSHQFPTEEEIGQLFANYVKSELENL
jgi:predicted HAD superfamily hydrolase